MCCCFMYHLTDWRHTFILSLSHTHQRENLFVCLQKALFSYLQVWCWGEKLRSMAPFCTPPYAVLGPLCAACLAQKEKFKELEKSAILVFSFHDEVILRAAKRGGLRQRRCAEPSATAQRIYLYGLKICS